MRALWIRDIIVYGLLLAFVLYVTKQNNMWGSKKGAKKTKVDSKKAKNTVRQRNTLLRILKRFEVIGDSFGYRPTETTIVNLNYKIRRARLKFKLLDRTIAPLELVGIFKVIGFVCGFIAVIGFLLTNSVFFLLFLLGLFSSTMFNMYVDSLIMQEDAEIESEFPDFFFLLYSRLLKGSKVRLAPTLDEYLKSLEAIHGVESHKAMRNFVQDLRNNIEIYGDDSMAVNKMREMYKSAMLVNFFNLALQSLKGVDNADKLLSFKMELTQKSLKAMEAVASKRREQGERAIWLIFIILGQFVVLSWLAKAGVGTITKILGI